MNSKDVDPRSIRLLATEYLSSPYVTLKYVGSNYNISARMVSNILWRGIAENILSTSTSEAIYAKVVHSSKRSLADREKRWNDAFAKRELVREKIEKKLAMYKKLEQLLIHRTEHYNEYVSVSSNPSSLKEINERLSKLHDTIVHYTDALS